MTYFGYTIINKYDNFGAYDILKNFVVLYTKIQLPKILPKMGVVGLHQNQF